MTRYEHIKWCKERAIQEMDFHNDPKQGIISMMSDLKKHPETSGEAIQSMCMMMLLDNRIRNRQEAINFINGFN